MDFLLQSQQDYVLGSLSLLANLGNQIRQATYKVYDFGPLLSRRRLGTGSLLLHPNGSIDE